MNATRRMAGLAFLGLSLICADAAKLAARDAVTASQQAQSSSAGGDCKYSMAEYNAEQAAAAEKNAASQVKLLDDFVAKYPTSCLLRYVYPLYYQNYYNQKNYPKVFEYIDKQLALGDKITASERYQAYMARAQTFQVVPSPDAATSKTAYQAALDGAKSVDGVPKPDGMDEAKFAEEKKKLVLIFNATGAMAAIGAKDYPNAITMYKLILASNPDDFVSDYQLGRAYSALTPPQTLDALWYYARAASSKSAKPEQSTQVKAYIPKAIANYQGNTVCDSITQAETNELLQLASSSADRPTSYNLYSAADLSTAQKDMTVGSVVTDLKAGGDKAKLAWTAACGLEFPDVPGKVISVDAGTDSVTIKLAFVTSDAEFDAATNPDLEVKVAAPAADADAKAKEAFEETKKVEKDNFMRFTGTLETYDPDPAFMLHWDKAKVNDEDLPKPGKKPTTKKPGAKKPS
jgi:hypothetical protein